MSPVLVGVILLVVSGASYGGGWFQARARLRQGPLLPWAQATLDKWKAALQVVVAERDKYKAIAATHEVQTRPPTSQPTTWRFNCSVADFEENVTRLLAPQAYVDLRLRVDGSSTNTWSAFLCAQNWGSGAGNARVPVTDGCLTNLAEVYDGPASVVRKELCAYVQSMFGEAPPALVRWRLEGHTTPLPTPEPEVSVIEVAVAETRVVYVPVPVKADGQPDVYAGPDIAEMERRIEALRELRQVEEVLRD